MHLAAHVYGGPFLICLGIVAAFAAGDGLDAHFSCSSSLKHASDSSSRIEEGLSLLQTKATLVKSGDRSDLWKDDVRVQMVNTSGPSPLHNTSHSEIQDMHGSNDSKKKDVIVALQGSIFQMPRVLRSLLKLISDKP
eukprot:gnl/TRDRNA2_/TRDRNA2_178737_c0_seq1.p1 gnl/TRDRNA2_/TRDRNA2_178737_c0~~gnl/TRDRNA2_/TRDRNA2_178737_c0_seq1.p1  ORF type:complete len:137 (-),score=20.08 gnl/TRDRNA2_/TRDRNA2_178737_c0_seq1:3-413(-)